MESPNNIMHREYGRLPAKKSPATFEPPASPATSFPFNTGREPQIYDKLKNQNDEKESHDAQMNFQ